MKLSILFIAALGLATATALPTNTGNHVSNKNLKDDLLDFVALLPIDEMRALVAQYIAEDPEVQAVVAYIKSDDFKDLVLALEAIPEYETYLDYLEDAGLNPRYYIELLHSYLGISRLSSTHVMHFRITGGVAGLIADIRALLPVDEMKSLFHEKLETSEDFRNLFDKLKSDKFSAIVSTLKANEKYQSLRAKAVEHGIDIDNFVNWAQGVINYNYSVVRTTRDLSDDLYDFVALIPVEEALQVFIAYLAEDAEVQAVVAYVFSENFKELVHAIEAIPEYQTFLDYLESAGLNPRYYIEILHSYLGISRLAASQSVQRKTRITGGIHGLIVDLLALIDVDAFKALYQDKIENSEAFRDLIEKINSEEFDVLIDALKANEEYQRICAVAREHGLDIDIFIDLLKKIFGRE